MKKGLWIVQGERQCRASSSAKYWLSLSCEIQRRLKVWQPRRAAVVGGGTIGLLATLAMRLRGLEVTCYSHRLPPYRSSDLITELGAHYVSSQRVTLTEASETHGPFDIIVEASGFSPLVFQAAETLGKNGVLILSSVTGGEKKVEAFFLGWLNKLLTTPVHGLENYAEMLHHLTEDKEAIKVYVEVAQAL